MPGEEHQQPWNRKLGGLQDHSARFGEGRRLFNINYATGSMIGFVFHQQQGIFLLSK
jgi:hypothetical protein